MSQHLQLREIQERMDINALKQQQLREEIQYALRRRDDVRFRLRQIPVEKGVLNRAHRKLLRDRDRILSEGLDFTREVLQTRKKAELVMRETIELLQRSEELDGNEPTL